MSQKQDDSRKFEFFEVLNFLEKVMFQIKCRSEMKHVLSQ
jgi:hypothetical protein